MPVTNKYKLPDEKYVYHFSKERITKEVEGSLRKILLRKLIL